MLLLMDASSKPTLFPEKSLALQWAAPGPHPTPRSASGAMQQYRAAGALSPALVDRLTDWLKGQFTRKPKASLTAHVMA